MPMKTATAPTPTSWMAGLLSPSEQSDHPEQADHACR